MEQPQKVISRNVWHFRYHCALKKAWGIGIKEEKSLCPYFWFTVSTTIATFIFLPVAILGWIYVKLFRITYKVLSCFPKFIDKIENKVFIGKELDWISKSTENSPFAVFTLTGIGTTLVLALLCCSVSVLYVIAINLYRFPFFLWDILGWCWFSISTGFMYVGWAITVTCSMFGYLLHWAGFGLTWLFTPAAIPIYIIILTWTVWIILATVVSFVIVYSLISFCQTNFFKKHILTWIMFKMNGFQTALEENNKRREALKEVKEALKEVKEADKPSKPKRPSAIGKFFKSIAEWWKKHWGNRVQKIQGQKVKVMGGFSVVWEMLIAIKTKNCPLLRFVDEEELQTTKSPQPTEKME